MNDGQYTNLRNYLEEIASQNRQILAELKRANESKGGATESKQPAKATKATTTKATTAKTAPAAANVERQLEAETGKDFTKTGDNPPTFAEADNPSATLRVNPAVPRREFGSEPPVEGLAAMGTMTQPTRDK